METIRKKYQRNVVTKKISAEHDYSDSILSYIHLWRRVIDFQVREYLFAHPKEKIKKKIELTEWIFGEGKEEFEVICDLAFYEISHIRKIIKGIISADDDKRIEYGNIYNQNPAASKNLRVYASLLVKDNELKGQVQNISIKKRKRRKVIPA